MSEVSDQLFQAIDTLIENKISDLQYDKTVQGTIYSVINLDAGEYKVRYNGNIFSAYAIDPQDTYKKKDKVYVIIPEGDFSNRKVITGLATSQSLRQNQLSNLQNAIFDISPTFDVLYGSTAYDPYASYGVIAGAPSGEFGSEIYIYNGSSSYEFNSFHSLFQQYANNYDLIKIEAKFLTQFYDTHNKGNYGLWIEFYAKGDDVVSYRLDLNSFNGDPYNLSIYSPQSAIIMAQKNYLLGLKSIRLFQEDFVYDRIYENGLVTDKQNKTIPNIFVKDITLSYVERKDLTDSNYYLTIVAPKGVAFTDQVISLDLQGKLIYKGENIMSSSCECEWYVRDLSVMVGGELYNKAAGTGWRPLGNSTNLLTLVDDDVPHRQRYKLLANYNDVSLSAEVEVFNHHSTYDFQLVQYTDQDDIILTIVNNNDDGELVGDWYLSYPDGTYLALDDGKQKNSVVVSSYLKYSSITFYCQIYDFDLEHTIGVLEHVIMNSESSADVSIAYTGEDTFRYDANGDISIEDSEKERMLQVILTWKEGYGTAYTVEWIVRDISGKEITLSGEEYHLEQSMMDKLWVDNSNILHYNIKQKYKTNFNNNTLIIKIKTIAEQEYRFDKEIIFLKDGDQGTNGTTYVIAVRPCDEDGTTLTGLRPLVFYGGQWRNTLPLRCFVYKDGDLINNDQNYTISYKWTGTNIGFLEDHPIDKVTARGQGQPGADSASQQFYVKVQVDINDMMNNRRTSIYASYPVDVAVGNIDYEAIDISSIPSYIKYTASGITPQFYNNNIIFTYQEEDLTSQITSVNTSLIAIEEREGLYYLKPASSFIGENIRYSDQSNIGVLKCSYNEEQYLLHSIIMYLDVYGNEAINGWDGEGIKREEEGEDAYILAPQVGAGSKDSQNRFSGVVMGKDTAREQLGLYGYKTGINTFGLMEDGTAFFGAKSGGGQIVIDGTSAEIYG